MAATDSRQQAWIYDWNGEGAPELPAPGRRVLLNDESLRDGLQSPSVRDPEIGEKLEILHLMAAVGVRSADLGLPGAGPRAYEDVLRLAREVADCRLPIRCYCAARTLRGDLDPIAKIADQTGLPLMAATFIGSSPIRRVAEDWTVEYLVATSRDAVRYARGLGLSVMFVTEDTTRCDRDTMRALYGAALAEGAEVITLCDTVGHATPAGARALVQFVRGEIAAGYPGLRVDWHGHSDRGLGVINALAAVAAGADCIHGCALGIGERAGNTALDQVIVNLALLGCEAADAGGGAAQGVDLTRLKEYVRAVARATGVAIPPNYPVMGADAFRTATGVHAAAVVKGWRKHDWELADRVYSGVPARWFGREQEIELGPMSGKWNAIAWLERHGYAPDEAGIARLLAAAKRSHTVLTEAEADAAWHSRD